MWVKRKDLFCFHGFLGTPQDWSFLKNKKTEQFYRLYPVDYFNNKSLQPKDIISFWGKQFWSEYQSHDDVVLLGYSLGGRLALQAFDQQPRRVHKLILLSSGLGRFTLEYAESKEKRLANDAKWAEQFLNGDWAETISQWNSQSIFAHSIEPERLEYNYDRYVLSESLKLWSQAYMQSEDRLFEMYRDKIIMVSGEKDLKYTSMYSQIAKAFKIPHIILQDAGHRVLFSHQEQIKQILETVL